MKKRFLNLGIIAAGLWLVMPAAANQNFDIGKAGAVELAMPMGSRPAAMGEAFVGLADDFNAAAWNPAGLAQAQNIQLGFLHQIYFQSIAMEYLTYAQPLSTSSGLGAYLAYFDYGTMDKTTEVNGAPEQHGSFSATGLSLAAAYGQWLSSSIAAGATVKMFSQTIDGASGTVVALDLGGLYKTALPGLSLGLALQNLGTPMAGSSLLVNLKAGAAYVVPMAANDRWTILLDFNGPTTDFGYASLNLGTEYSFNQMLAARLGYKVKDSGNLGGVMGLTAGLGVKFAMLQVDYALVTFGDLGLTHQIMLSADFGYQAKPQVVVKEVVKEKQVIVYRDNPEDAKARAKIQELEAQKKSLEEQLAKFKKDIEVGTLKPILFETNKSTLLISAYDTLDYLGKILAHYPELVVRIEGHTDDQGTAAHNLTLSQERAEAVCHYLIAKVQSIKADHLIPIGFGKTRPVAKGSKAEARAKNRRVEFVVINPYLSIKK